MKRTWPNVLLFTAFAAVVSALCLFSVPTSAQNNNQIINLPGVNFTVPFKQYAGYINVDPAHGRQLFYWFTESQNNPAADPLVIWLNGGPGCSSLGGFFQELGPFNPNPDGKSLRMNPHSWNRVANVIFLESPAGVGFSYSNTPSDYTVGDERTANDSYTFLLKFIEMYPQFSHNDFYVSGESYGGHYVPNLAHRILQGNKQSSTKINIKGFLVGNAWTDAPIDNFGAVYFWETHAIISERTFLGLNETCDFATVGPLFKRENSGVDPAKCNQYQNDAFREMGNINIYDIYADVCLGEERDGNALLHHLATSDSTLSTIAKSITKKNKIRPGAPNPDYPCSDEAVQTYLNLPNVQAAIHAHPLPYKWTDCTSRIHYSRKDLLTSMLPIYRDMLQENNFRMLVYSGDIDAIVPVTGTRMWLDKLNLTEKETWRPWIGSNKQVGGYIVRYLPNLTFMTVRGAGHLVPGTQPLRALDMFSRFIKGEV